MRKLPLALSLAAAVAMGAFIHSERAQAAAPKVRAFIALMTPGQEPSPVASSGGGVAFLTFDERTSLLSYSFSVDTDDTVMAAHIHGPGQPGVNAGIAFSVATARVAAGSVGPLSKAQAKDLKKGLLYFNFHTDLGPNGEIRGQIVPVAAAYAPLNPQ